MVYNPLGIFFQIHQNLNQMLRITDEKPFVGFSIILCGDLYQPLPVRGYPIYASKSSF